MRLILICLTVLLMLIQFPLWLGKGGWLRVWELDKQVMAAQKKNDELKARNAKLNSEVLDLKQGTGAVEERARFELGMIKDNEIFVQVLDQNGKVAPPPAAPSATQSEAMPTANTAVPVPSAVPPATSSAKAIDRKTPERKTSERKASERKTP